MRDTLRRYWYPAAAVALALLASALAYPSLPARVPVHWNIVGDVDRYGAPLEGALTVPVVMVVLAVLIPVLPRIDPRRASYAKFRGTYHLVMNAVLTLLLVVHLVLLAAALGADVAVARIVPAAVGVLLIVLGNVLPRTRPNWMFGVRTPWTLSNDRVWARTHRVGGYLLVLAGLVHVAAALLLRGPATFAIVLGSALAAAFGTVVYSYVAWRQETRR